MFQLIALVQFILVSLLLSQHSVNSAASCKINEFKCGNGKCIELDRYCNGIVDCDSDEPRHCTPCNRTYYGVKSSTYNLQLHNPQTTKSTFSCILTFVADGGQNGDLIQLKFHSIFLAKKTPQQEISNCENTKLIIQEPDRQIYSEFCHYSLGSPFFSESNRVIVMFVTNELSNQFNFDFKLSFKFLGMEEASVRYGNGLFRGNLLPGTPCSLLFNNCYRERCALQSPNYPGLYPRNVTCYYAIRHHNNPDLMNYYSVINLETISLNIQSRQQGNLTFSNSKDFKTNCVDSLTVYDGYTIRDPVLLSVCGSGKLDNITSSGEELLVEFHSTGINLFSDEQQALHSIQGFNMIATIRQIELNSNKYVGNHNCVFRTSSLYNKSGYLEEPNHSLPSGTLCMYHIQGNNHELIWLQVIYYNVFSVDCNNTYLAIYDGAYDSQNEGKNLPLLKICNNQTETLRSCEYKINRNQSRPCNRDESYTSTANQMTIRTRTESGTILDKLKFKIYYEFIDTKQDGLELRQPCSRLITQPGYFHSPKNTFLFGRGGQKHIHCIYQFLPGTISFEYALAEISQTCRTNYNRQTHRHECYNKPQSHSSGKHGKRQQQQPMMSAQLKHYKVFHNETRILDNCFCTNINGSLKFSSKYPQQIELILQNMEPWVDSNNYYFNGSYSKERPGREDDEAEHHTYSSLSGSIYLTSGSVAVVSPPTIYHYAYVFSSEATQNIDCNKNIVVVHYNLNANLHNSISSSSSSASSMINNLVSNGSNTVKVCPNEVLLYSPNYHSVRSTDSRIVLEYVGEAASIKLHFVMIQKQSESSACEFYCGSIDGCLPTQVLCDGIISCPDGSDEAMNCHFNYNYEYLILIFVIILITLISLYIYHNCGRRKVKSGSGDS